MPEDQISRFGAIVMEARNSGPMELRDRWFGGWKPKKPDAVESDVANFISCLDEKQRRLFLRAVAYFVDASFFKLIELMESGSGDVQFSLIMHARAGDTVLIDPESDNNLGHAFFKWRERHGSLETPS